jgi:transcriptional regulator with XRE-family HTH domain
MKTEADNELGALVKHRRGDLGLSVRGLASSARVSPAYVTAIETGRSSSTGKPPSPSAVVLAKLAGALGLDVSELVAAATSMAETDPRHTLLYVINEAQSDPFDVLDAHFGTRVDHWFYIPDPRGLAPEPPARVTVCLWPLGQAPYDSTTLDPAALMVALEEALKAHADGMEGKRVGIAIADCSAVMRFVQNPAKHVQMERTWHDNVSRLWAQYLRTAPAIDVCVYRDDDIDALGLTIDRLATTLELVERHDLVCVLSSGSEVTVGRPAVRTILESARPGGVSSSSWGRLVAATSVGLATTNKK